MDTIMTDNMPTPEVRARAKALGSSLLHGVEENIGPVKDFEEMIGWCAQLAIVFATQSGTVETVKISPSESTVSENK